MRFRSPITGKFVSLAVARRWGYPSEAQRLSRLRNLKKARAAKKKKPKPKPKPKRRAPPKRDAFDELLEREAAAERAAFVPGFDLEEIPGEEFFFAAEAFEDIEYDQIGDLDFNNADFLESFEDFDDVDEIDYEEPD